MIGFPAQTVILVVAQHRAHLTLDVKKDLVPECFFLIFFLFSLENGMQDLSVVII